MSVNGALASMAEVGWCACGPCLPVASNRPRPMPLTMIQITPDMNRLIYWANQQCLLALRGEDDLGYTLHAILTAAFGEHSPKPFAFHPAGSSGVSSAGHRPQILGYTTAIERELRYHASAFAD